MRLLLMLVAFLFCAAVHADPIDSTTLNGGIERHCPRLFTASHSTKDIPHFIKAAIIRKSNGDYRITDKAEKFNLGDCEISASEYHLLLGYVAHTSRYYIITYIRGGLGNCSHVLLIKYNRHRIATIYNFILLCPKHIGMLAKCMRAADFKWDYSTSF